MKGCTFPGNTISCEGAERWGETTETEGTAICAVSARTVFLFRRRAKVPYTRIPARTSRITPATTQPRFERRRASTTPSAGGSCGGALICVCDFIAINHSYLSNHVFIVVPRQEFAGADRG